MKDFYLNAEQKNKQRQAKELERLIYFGTRGQDYDIDKNVLNYFKQPEKNMKQVMTLDLNVLDLCTIDQLQEIETLIRKIKYAKHTEKTALEQEHVLRVKEEKKRNIENKYKAFDAIRLRITEQERFLQEQRNLLEKTGQEYTKMENAYNEEYRIANK